MEEETQEMPFVFEDHILFADYSCEISKVEKELAKAKNKFTFFKKSKKEKILQLEEKLNEYNEIQCASSNNYNYAKDFFECIEKMGQCDLKYKIERTQRSIKHTLYMSGSGCEEFAVESNPDFLKKGNNFITKIPVIVGEHSEKITLYRQIQEKIKPGQILDIKYKFKSRVYFGQFFDGEPANFEFTNDIFCRLGDFKKNGDLKNGYFYGVPGKIYLRPFYFDGLTTELDDAIFEKRSGNGKFDMQGEIIDRKSEKLIYQGTFDCHGFFPYFVLKYPDSKKPHPIDETETQNKDKCEKTNLVTHLTLLKKVA